MLYSELSEEQQQILAAFERNFRGWVNSHISRGIAEARALDAAATASNGAVEILALLDAGTVIPNSSGIAGAHSLTKEELEAFISAGLQAFLTSYDTPATRRLASKLAGPTAGL